ncbi:sulfatase [Fulvivirga sedimenti]|uniref:Sulfatase-like hydrolase/transferase n=1 Tax=Fulvivirga sedimenti TaxID=2879465 RepID=A0A9X1KX38_9BACT|nr:sulfatase-like hydrolase/transferase [Fulvivirga sedimenti]MCA6075440.1 sulfatase-like hydrolase/transferase [Fulvivirga sedimenti]MCA6076617.1 sulfatase-like hydrolase/transferase [Fulvivirga sedimenti]MCA6077745.1 sulfatase-like hydrolase/transferase [Fulvivirga sedimenti]
MKKKIKNLFVPSIIIIPSLLIYMFIPMDKGSYNLEPDTRLLNGKEEYLNKPGGLADSSKTNILWLIVDDLSIADTDLYTDGPVHVPNLIRLAKRGVKFTNAYVSSPVCSPSRASILTGRYNQRFGFEHQLHERYLSNRIEYYAFKYLIDSYPWEPQYQTEVPDEQVIAEMGLPLSEISLAEIVKKQGYSSAYIGKWHVGKLESNSPLAFGFNEFYGFMASHSLYVPEGTPGFTDQKIPEDFTDEYIWEGQREGLHAIRKNGQEISESRYLTDAITDEAIEFISKNNDNPFYCVAAYNAPHTPLQAPDEYVNEFAGVEDPYKRVHYAMIKSLDDNIGRLLDYLDETGLAQNTLVMFISDNGGAEYNLTTDNGDYQGGKITNFEGGVKVPMLMSWPGVIPENSTYDQLTHATDLFMTSANAAGASLSGDRIYDGANLLESVLKAQPAHEYVFFQMGDNRAVRNARWKLTWNEDNGDSSLYFIKEDPFEFTDRYAEKPPVIDSLVAAFKEWSALNRSAAWPSMIYYHYTDVNGKEHYFDE